jgi:hypothetical protein
MEEVEEAASALALNFRNFYVIGLFSILMISFPQFIAIKC